MAFSNKNDDAAMSEINVTPLVDVMLVLLIIFIVTAPLLTQSITVHLPQTEKANPDNSPKDHVVNVELTLAGQLKISKKEKELFTFPVGEKEKIKSAFYALLKQDNEPVLAFAADDKMPHGDVMRIIQMAENAGITHISFLTTEEMP